MNIIEAYKQNEKQAVRRVDQEFIYWRGEMKHFNEYHNDDITGEWTVLLDEVNMSLDDFIRVYKDVHPHNDEQILFKFLRKLGV